MPTRPAFGQPVPPPYRAPPRHTPAYQVSKKTTVGYQQLFTLIKGMVHFSNNLKVVEPQLTASLT